MTPSSRVTYYVRQLKRMDISPRDLFIRLLLVAVFGVAVVRLVGFAIQFGLDSLQVDFTTFYTAGQAMNHGLSPYVNHVAESPSVWDGVAGFEHSRFLHPPLVATLFRPLSLLPYATAKFVWMGISLASVAVLRATARLYYDVGPFDPLTFAAATGVLLLAALLAIWLPARRTARVDPVNALSSQ